LHVILAGSFAVSLCCKSTESHAGWLFDDRDQEQEAAAAQEAKQKNAVDPNDIKARVSKLYGQPQSVISAPSSGVQPAIAQKKESEVLSSAHFEDAAEIASSVSSLYRQTYARERVQEIQPPLIQKNESKDVAVLLPPVIQSRDALLDSAPVEVQELSAISSDKDSFPRAPSTEELEAAAKVTNEAPPVLQYDEPPVPKSPSVDTVSRTSPLSKEPESLTNQSVEGDQMPLSDEASVSMLKEIVGLDGLPLNIDGVSFPADVQSTVHMDEAVAFALKNNFEVSAAQEKTRGAYWDKMGAYSQYIPSVEFSADTGPERSQPASINDENGARVPDSVHHRRDRSITITQPLIDLGIVADILSSGDKEDIAQFDQNDVREGVAFETASTYLNLLQARIAVRLAADYKRYLDELAVRIKARVEGGGAPAADLDRIHSRSTIADGARIEALGEYETQLAEFRRLTKITPPQLAIPKTLAPPVPQDMEQAMSGALKANPTYLSGLKKIELATEDRNKSLSGLLPKLSFQYSNTNAYNAGDVAHANETDGTVFPMQKTQNVMLVAQWALYGGTAITGGLSGAAKQREMNYRSLDIRARLEQGIRSSYTSINAGHDRQAALQKTIEANERVVAGFEYQFANGTRSLFDLLDAYEQLYSARLNFVRVTIACAKASYQVHRQMGQLIPVIIGAEGR